MSDTLHNLSLRKRLTPLLKQVELRFVLDNDPGLIAPLVAYLQRRARQLGGQDPSKLAQVALALHEALANALYHGNLEFSSQTLVRAATELSPAQWQRLLDQRRAQPPYCDRRIYVRARLSPVQTTFMVRDDGFGFDVSQLADPTSPEGLEREHGRGVFLMRAMMDEVRFNASGNAVLLVKRLSAANV